MMSLVLVRDEVDREMKICVNDGRISFICSGSAASGLHFLPDRAGTRRALTRDAQCYHAEFVTFCSQDINHFEVLYTTRCRQQHVMHP